MICHYETIKGVGRVFFPGCMGGAVYGIDGCTCERKTVKELIVELEGRMLTLEEQIKQLKEK